MTTNSILPGLEPLQEFLADRYVVERELGKGGMATVYLARDLRHGRQVAIKVLRPDLAAGIGADRFRTEIEIAAALAHPGILPVFDSGGADDALFYVMPYIEGESLRQRLERDGSLPVEQALRIVRDVGEALAYAHSRNIVHRDIKPENILLVHGHAVVADFGIARALANAAPGAERLTLPGMAPGTPLYMSPEQASGVDVDARSDIYSLGCVLYEMLDGNAPHAAGTPWEMIARKFPTSEALPRMTRGDAPPGVDAAIRKALATDPQARFASATEFVDALSAATGQVEATGRAQIDTPTMLVAPTMPATRTARRRRAVGGVVVAAVAVAAIAVGLWRVRLRPAVDGDGRIGMAVLPFRATMAGARQWTEAVPDLLATALDGTPGVRVVDPWSLWRRLRADPSSPPRAPDVDEAAQLAASAHASSFLLGSISQLQNQVQVTIKLYRRGSDAPWRTLTVSGPPDSLSAIVRQLALQTMGVVSPAPAGAALARFDRGLTRSPEALKAWLGAREFRRRGQLDSADAAITRAITIDSTFMLALVDAISIRTWVQSMRGERFTGYIPLAERVVRLSDSLPERQRLRAVAMLASVRTEGPRAAGALERIVALDSADVDAWRLLGYVHNVYGWQYGATERDAIAAAEQVIHLDSTEATAVVFRTSLAAGTADSAGLDAQMRRLQLVDTTSALVRGTMRAVRASRAGDQEFRGLLERVGDASPNEWRPVYTMLRGYRPDRAELLAGRVTHAATPAFQRAGLLSLSEMLAAESRWRAMDSLRAAGAIDAGFAPLANRLTAAAAIAGAADEATGRRAVDALSAALPADSALAWLNTHAVWLDGWMIGAFHAMYGDTLLARRWHTALGTLPEGVSPREYAKALREDIESRLAARRGNLPSAIQHAGSALTLWNIHTENDLEIEPEPAMRFSLASLLRATGKSDSAAALFRSLVPPTAWMGFYTARAALELGELQEAKGQRALAMRSFLAALKLWEHGDAIVAPFRERARRGVGRSS